jgi:hypothetical protein
VAVWLWQPNVGFSLKVDPPLRCGELALWANNRAAITLAESSIVPADDLLDEFDDAMADPGVGGPARSCCRQSVQTTRHRTSALWPIIEAIDAADIAVTDQRKSICFYIYNQINAVRQKAATIGHFHEAI